MLKPAVDFIHYAGDRMEMVIEQALKVQVLSVSFSTADRRQNIKAATIEAQQPGEPLHSVSLCSRRLLA
ncbi:MAG: hypothetical protein ACRD10_00585, partial [Terriglobia bacterium]